MSEEKSVAHLRDMNIFGLGHYPDRLVPWREAQGPDLDSGRTTGSLRGCGYCGSMHPADLAAAIRNGAQAHWADFKYGWPHKAYVDGIQNPHVGMLESRCSTSNPPQAEIDAGKWVRMPTGEFSQSTGEPTFTYREPGKPAKATTSGKFYTVHLLDASPEDRQVIEQHLGLSFEFDEQGGVRWWPVGARAAQ